MKLLDMGTTPSPPYRMRSALGKEPLDNDNDDEDEDDGMSSPPATAVRSIGRDASIFNQAINYVSDNTSTTATATGGVASSATAVASSVSTGTADRMSSSDRLSSLSDAITRLRAASQLPSSTATTTTTSSGAQAMQFNYSQPPPGDHHNGGGIGGGSREYRGAFGPLGYGLTTTTTTSTTGKRGSPLSDRALMAALSRAQRGLLGGGNGSEGYNETTTSIASRQGLGQQGRGTGMEGGGGEINPPRHSVLLGRMLVDHRPYPSSSQTLASSSSSSNAAAVAAAYAAIGIVSTVPTKATDMTTVVAMTTTATTTSITTATTTTTAASTTSTTAPIIATSNGPAVPSMMERRVKTVDFAPIDVVHRADAHIVPATAMSQYPTRATTTTTTASTLAPTSVLPMSVQPSAHASLHAPVPPSSTHVSTATTATLPVTSSSSSGGAEAGQGLGTGQGLGQGQGSVYFRRQLANFGPVAVGCMARQELGKYTHFTL